MAHGLRVQRQVTDSEETQCPAPVWAPRLGRLEFSQSIKIVESSLTGRLNKRSPQATHSHRLQCCTVRGKQLVVVVPNFHFHAWPSFFEAYSLKALASSRKPQPPQPTLVDFSALAKRADESDARSERSRLPIHLHQLQAPPTHSPVTKCDRWIWGTVKAVFLFSAPCARST